MTQHGVTNKHFQAIGRIIIDWAVLEHAMTAAISKLLAARGSPLARALRASPPEVDKADLVITYGTDARTKLGLLRMLVGMRLPSDADEFNKLAKRIERAADARNIIAHGLWVAGQRPGTISTHAIKTIGHLTVTPHEYSVDELERLARRIVLLTDELIKFLETRKLWKQRPSP